MVKKMMSHERRLLIEEMNLMLGGLTLEDLQTVFKGRAFRFPVYPDMKGMEQDVSAMDISTRSVNALHRNDMGDVKSLVQNISKDEDLCHLRNLGKLSVQDVMFGVFLYQFSILDQAAKKRYMQRVLELNGIHAQQEGAKATA